MLTFKRQDIKVGTHLYFIRQLKYAHYKTITITKIGRKWAYWGDHEYEKLDLETMQPCYSGCGKHNELWDSKIAYEENISRKNTINDVISFFTSISLRKRQKLTYEKAIKILEILNESEVQDE